MSQREFDAKYNQIPGLAPAVAGLAQLHAKPSMSRIETLQALQNLRESGALSEVEFDREKKLLLASNRS
jgi:hypothetical protein